MVPVVRGTAALCGGSREGVARGVTTDPSACVNSAGRRSPRVTREALPMEAKHNQKM